MGGIAGHEHRPGPEGAGHPGVAVEAAGVLHAAEAGRRQVPPQHGGGLRHQIALLGGGPHVHPPALPGQGREDQRRGVEVGRVGLVGVGPALHRRIEHGPGAGDGMALEADAAQLAGGAAQAVAAHHPGASTVCSRSPQAIVAVTPPSVGLEAQQPAGAVHRAALALEMAGEDRFGHLFREAEVEAVAAAAGGQIQFPQPAAVGMDQDPALPAAGGQKGLLQTRAPRRAPAKAHGSPWRGPSAAPRRGRRSAGWAPRGAAAPPPAAGPWGRHLPRARRSGGEAMVTSKGTADPGLPRTGHTPTGRP